MIDYYSSFKNHLERIHQEKRYRKFVPLKRLAGDFPYAMHMETNEKIIMWCINDYLGMGQNKNVINSAKSAIEEMGAGTGGTRNIGGNNHEIVLLENILAKLHNKEKSLVFTSGYVANDTTLSTIAKIIPDIIFLSDEDNHASIIHGIKNSRAEKFIYNHLDVKHLRKILESIPKNRSKMIVFESIYSMDGLESPIKEILELAREFNALTYIDEVHTVGLYGKKGSGIASLRGFSDQIDIIQGTLGKAFGVIGGYISGKYDIIESIRLSAPGFIFTTALPPSIARSARASVEYLMNSDKERKLHQEISKYLKYKMEIAGIEYIKNNSHIVPVTIGDPVLCQQATDKLLFENKIFVQNINFPTVPKGTERLRFTPTPCHTEEMANNLVEVLKKVFYELKITQKNIVAA